ncbi:hypothetical protein DACRYDRAFT_105677 [Dacryopinax primogenitus]|uniref:Transcription factor IIIC 90kDa subunit N-terminal domain-containing protein n=1 Tax=Dacryopinax primogenitus (strain DJM 731) TaxID=1858805 RepID=M5GER7_DACPD|nr:uncharacterized protein DACRYDRAFT_105677 [Dacryopinax primogenitus]EJU03518.1 hypothetical protein DACRYDRAFT_105677 [Dacryopinax primogenitus]
MVWKPDIHIAVELSAPPARSCPTAIQQNEDGQFGVLIKEGIHILTPDIGLAYDPGTADVATVPALRKPDREPLKVYRAVAEIALGDHIAWADESLDMATMVPGSVSIQCKDFAWSPIGLGQDGRCLLAVLTTNLEVFMYGAGKNYVDGQWLRVFTLTDALLETAKSSAINGKAKVSSLRRTLQAQTTALAWSAAVRASGVPSSRDLSLLALGSRAGTVSLWRSGKRQATVVLGEEWVAHLSWAGWLQMDADTVASVLACGLSDGSVHLVTVTQKITDHSFDEVQAVPSPALVQPDLRGLTALRWVYLQTYPLHVLVYAKPGLLGLIAPTGSGLDWVGERRLVVQKQPVFLGSTALGIPSGLDYLVKEDALLVSYSDGSIHVIHSVSTDPTLEMPGSRLQSAEITRAMRRTCMDIEGPGTPHVAVMQTFGCHLVSSGVALWSYQKTLPTFIDYVPEFGQITSVTLAKLFDPSHDTTQSLQNVQSLCFRPTPPFGPPVRLAPKLLPIYLDLEANRNSDAIRSELDHLLDASPSQSTDASLSRSSLTWKTPDTEDLLRCQLIVDLIDGDEITTLRNKLAILKLANKFGYSFADRIPYVQTLILALIFAALSYTAADPSSLLLANDPVFARRIVSISQCMPISIGTDVAVQALAASNKVDQLMPSSTETDGNSDGIELNGSIDVGDICVVCKASMPVRSLEMAHCSNGHVWGKFFRSFSSCEI